MRAFTLYGPVDIAELDYELPERAIAQSPVEPRDSARLFVDHGPRGSADHRHVYDLPELVGPGDLIVVNDTKVIPARLRLRKPSGGAVEVLLLERRANGDWEALIKPSRRVASGTVLVDEHGDGDLTVTAGDVIADDGRRLVSVRGGNDSMSEQDQLKVIENHGEVPLPPYIHAPLADPSRYQTVFAHNPGSVAAPTAGLHLTTEVLERCKKAGAKVATVELLVGLGTFRPITVDRVEDHPMHAERYRISPRTKELIDSGQHQVLAVGTTVVRALETYGTSGEVQGATSLFIRDGYEWQIVDRLMTNFHVPRSSLLALVRAFVGPRWRDVYEIALNEKYRFLSFGDAMLLERRDHETTAE